jgi:hypothetical protein
MNRQKILLSVGCILGLFLWACSSEVNIDPEAELASLLTVHNAQEIYHLEEDSVAMAELLSDIFKDVSDGVISPYSFERTRSRLHDYFSSVDIVKWEDVQPPEVRFSKDFSMAYTLVDKEVVVEYEDGSGGLVRDTSHFAWVAIYQKYPEGWKIDCVASTNQ